ncbi:protein brambleberry-like [Vespula squamosa]|uniref:Protein brambleberry-like n=1 Tax=Vespula squamosa TaxID=30214 RepID=A0ABD2A3E7_VESSQ
MYLFTSLLISNLVNRYCYKMANLYLWIFMLTLISNQANSATLFSWLWGTPTDDTNVLVADGVPLISIPYETMTEDEKFLQEAAKFTDIQVSSPLETCQHKVIMKIRTSCYDMTEEQLAKLSVNLLNCQSAVEGRKMFPCTEEMSLKQCTTDMDADMWNAYHLMSNRARAVCYAARSTQFRALTELTVNKLMQTAHSQIKTLISLKENQDHLMDRTSEALSSLSDSNKALLLQQQNLKDAQTTAHKLVTTNLRNLNNEKALIRLGHTQLATMVEDVKEKLEKASEELVKQSTLRGESHKEILHDLTNIRNQAQLIWEKVESSTTLILDQHQEAADQYEQMMEKLARINDTIQFISNVTNKMRTEIEQNIHQLDWITDYIGDTGEQLQKVYRTVLHIVYLLIAMITAAFLNAPFWTRAAIMGIVPLNLCSYLKHGLEACLDFPSITALIFLITMMHFLMIGIQYICKSKFQNSEPVRLINTNGLSNGNTRIYASPSDSNSIQTVFMGSVIKTTVCNLFITILNKINSLKEKTSNLIQSVASWSRQNLSAQEQLSCSYTPAKKSHEDIYDYDYPDMSDDISPEDIPNKFDDSYNVTNDVNNFMNRNNFRYRLKGVKEFVATTEQKNLSINSSRSSSPVPRMLCNGLTRSGKRCRLFATVGREFCSRHITIRRVFFTRIVGNYRKNLMRQSVSERTNGTLTKEKPTDDSCKTNIPAPEPGKFQAAILNKFDNSLIIQNLESFTTAQPNEVIIDVNYCAVNHSDVLLSKNMYICEPKLPITLGYEIVGNLVYVGKDAEDKGYKIGDKVIALNKERYGGFAEQCVAEVTDIWKVPSNVKSLDAVCLLNDYISALIALERVVTIDENDMILVNVGLNSIGLATIDLATNVFRSQVIGICINNDDAVLVRNKGVFASFAYNERDLTDCIEEITGDKGIKAVFDGDGGEYFKKVLKWYNSW